MWRSLLPDRRCEEETSHACHILEWCLVRSKPETVFAFMTLRNTSFFGFVFLADHPPQPPCLGSLVWLGFCPLPYRERHSASPQSSSFLLSPSPATSTLCSGTFWNNRAWSAIPAVYFLPSCQEREAEDDYLCLSGGGAEPSAPAAETGWWRGQQQPVW